MNVGQLIWKQETGWDKSPASIRISPQLILVFWSLTTDQAAHPIKDLKQLFPEATIMGCSSFGEIIDTQVHHGTVTATLVEFESATVVGTKTNISDHADSMQLGATLAQALPAEGLRHVLAFSDPLSINGSDLAKGIIHSLPNSVSVTGGMACHSENTKEIYTLLDDAPNKGEAVAVGLYGESLKIGYASRGGWDALGPERLITKSESNVLYELDDEPALAVYENYLGKHAEGLPATGLLFPLSIRKKGSDRNLTRAVIDIDREEQTITFAGDIPQGTFAQLMMSNFDRLVDGATTAAQVASQAQETSGLALLVSCMARKVLLKQRVSEEIEAVRDVFGEAPVIAGFYSYGELAPFSNGGPCYLHNETMTITTIDEE